MHCPAVPTPCPDCGYHLPTPPCGQCGGRVQQPDGYGRVVARRRFFPIDFCHGFIAFWRGALLLFRPEFAGRLGVPIAANLVTFAALGVGLFLGFQALFDALVGADWGWATALKDSGGWAASILLTLVTLFLIAPPLIEAATAPFLDPLAEAAERQMCGPGFTPPALGTWRSIWIGVRSSAQIMAVSVLVLVPGWLLALLLPGLGFLLVFTVGAALAAVIWFEIPFARRGYGLRHRMGVLRRNWARALGFGCAFQIGMAVPLFNLVLLTPAACMGATVLYFHFDKRPAPPRPAPHQAFKNLHRRP